MSELKPCPFCGGKACMITHRFNRWPNTYSVKCLDCYVQTPLSYATEQEALNAWNRRVDTPHKCGDCEDFHVCEEYVDPSETFPEVGGCPAFKEKEESNDKP